MTQQEEGGGARETPLRLFIDTSDVKEVRRATESGVVGGVAMNPGKVAEAGRPVAEIVAEIREFFAGPISIQGTEQETDAIVKEAIQLSGISRNLCIKVPVTEAGIKAIGRLVPRGVKTNATLVFSAGQALLAGLAGSPFISPFIGRTTDVGGSGIELIETIRAVYERYDISTQIIAASVKNVSQVVDAVLAGAHMIALPPKVFPDMCTHPQTIQGIDDFLCAAGKK